MVAMVSVITLRVTIFYSKPCSNCVTTWITWCVSGGYPLVNICRMDKQKPERCCSWQQNEVKNIRFKQKNARQESEGNACK